MVSDRPSQEGKLFPGAPNEPVPFGRYYLLGLIARGGMAEVYRAKPQVGARRLLAVKVMRPQLAREARFVDMFHREGKLALLLQNRCIVETLELGQHDGRHFITMEYIGGRDLTQVLRRCQETQQRIPVPHAVYIAARIAEGLHFAHTLAGPDGRPLSIVNRDVSPSNVRLSYDGDVKLLDFGIAQALLMKFTSEIGILKGKFSYMSPEQIRGMPLDARTDVFSAGIILHEMLTTEKLFRGDTEFALMEKVRKAEVPAPSEFNRRVTAELERLDDAAVLEQQRELAFAVEHVDEARLARQLRPHHLDREQPARADLRLRAIDLGHAAARDQPEQEVAAERHRLAGRARRHLAFLRRPIRHHRGATTSPRAAGRARAAPSALRSARRSRP